MIAAIIATIWLVFSALSYSASFAYFQGRFPDEKISNMLLCAVLSLFGPASFFGWSLAYWTFRDARQPIHPFPFGLKFY